MMDDTLFRQVVTCFNDKGIAYWVDSGTLLGLVREGKIIDWDTDFDLSVWDHEVTESDVLEALQLPGIKTVSQLSRGINSINVFSTGSQKDGKVDITFYTKVENYALHIQFLPPQGQVTNFLNSLDRFLDPHMCAPVKMKRMIERVFHVGIVPLMPRFFKAYLSSVLDELFKRNFARGTRLIYKFPCEYLERFCTTTFLGVQVNIPERSEEHLSRSYGPDWRIPRQWDHWYEGATVVSPAIERNT